MNSTALWTSCELDCHVHFTPIRIWLICRFDFHVIKLDYHMPVKLDCHVSLTAMWPWLPYELDYHANVLPVMWTQLAYEFDWPVNSTASLTRLLCEFDCPVNNTVVWTWLTRELVYYRVKYTAVWTLLPFIMFHYWSNDVFTKKLYSDSGETTEDCWVDDLQEFVSDCKCILWRIKPTHTIFHGT